jgi:hypothetical protein
MEKVTLNEILAKNPQVDREVVNNAINLVRQLRSAGVKSKSIAASPPSDPYSGYGNLKTQGSRKPK